MYINIYRLLNAKTIGCTAIAFSTVCATGCSKNWLDQKPDKNLTIPANLKDFESLLDDYPSNFSPLTSGEAGTPDHYITDAIWGTSLSNKEKNLYTWSHDFPNLEVTDWNYSYTAILNTNIVLEGLQKMQDPKIDNQYNRVKGNALFTRSRLFFELAQLWGAPYDSSSSSGDLSIPLKLDPDINSLTTRGSVHDVYSRVLEDLMQAKDLLPMKPAFKTRPSKAAAFGLLARIFLTMGDYKKAYLFSDSCLSVTNTLLDYNQLDTQSPFVGAFNDEVIYHSSGSYNTSVTNSYIDPGLFSNFDTNDLRKVIYFQINPDSTIQFKGNYFNSTTEYFSGIATDEMYLIRSECNARLGNLQEAQQDLNILLSKRWKTGTYIPLNFQNETVLLSFILNERERELVMRGLRWIDLRRINKDPLFAKTFTRSVDGRSFVLEPDSYKYTLPIPDDVLKLSHVQQNEGW